MVLVLKAQLDVARSNWDVAQQQNPAHQPPAEHIDLADHWAPVGLVPVNLANLEDLEVLVGPVTEEWDPFLTVQWAYVVALCFAQ